MEQVKEGEQCCSCVLLKKRISELESELHALKLSQKTQETMCLNSLKSEEIFHQSTDNADVQNNPYPFNKCALSNNDIARYSRQILLPEINGSGQKKLIESAVLIVGVGGLGCPAAIYLAAAGVGLIGLVDYDAVDLSNLQRQILHQECTQNVSKVQSAAEALKKLNSSVNLDLYNTSLTSHNCMEILRKYDIVLDCSDNVATRYMLNDACLKCGKVLVSGSALRWEGQMTVYNHEDGPCYRCLYPSPPPPETVTNCSDGGVLGAITGVIGALQALEAIKILSGNGSTYSGRLLLFDGLCGTFRTIKLRGKVKGCICGIEDTSTLQLVDYEEFCGSKADDKEKKLNLLQHNYRVPVTYLYNAICNNPHLLLDVRPRIEFDICSLQGSVNLPLSEILNKKDMTVIKEALTHKKEVLVLCKRGNESQKALLEILKYVKDEGFSYEHSIKDVIGGLAAWNKQIDHTFPVY